MSAPSAPRYVIQAPSYTGDIGGVIVLHRLCHVLNEMGEHAVLRPIDWKWELSLRERLREALRPPRFETAPGLDTPVIADRRAGPGDIVLYPEIVPGNPLRARNVARWLLNRPSLTGRSVTPGPRDLFFRYDDRCEEPALTGGASRPLFLFQLNTLYEQRNFGPRRGSCYMLRKGRGRPLVHDLEDSILVDDLPHEELVRVFNERELFYSYDEMTSYSQFAAICGCTSVVIPKEYDSREAYVAAYPLSRYGVAYGIDDIPHALATRHLVRDYLRGCEREGLDSVRGFVAATRSHFGFPPPG